MADKAPSTLGLVLTFLRSKRGWTKKRLAAVLGMGDRSLLSRYERGYRLNRERLDALVAPLGYPPEAAEVLRFADRLISLAESALPEGLTVEERGRISAAAMAAGWTAGELMYAELVRRKQAEKGEAVRRDAEEPWARLKQATAEDRNALMAGFPEFQSPALAARVCAASLRAAPRDARKALELAELALSIAGRVTGEDALRSRAQGYCWAHVGNARRVGNDLDGADEAFTCTWDLWPADTKAGDELFPEWRLLSLEASLRRAQRRLPQALELLNRARTLCAGGRPNDIARILLQKETVLDLMGDIEGALAALAEAAPLIESTVDHDLLLRSCFNMAVDLCHLERHAEAAALLPRVRELAIEQANELDLLRVVWLEARIDAQRGRVDQALAALESVSEKFAGLRMPYDAALASLDLALLWLEAGHTAKVRELAVEMEAIFRAMRIDREALAALTLFWEAARRDNATVELVRQVIAEIEVAKRSAPPPERPR